MNIKMDVYSCLLKNTFMNLELFLQKVAALDIFEALIFKYKLKSGLLDHVAVHFLPIVSEFINQLQTLSRTFYEHNSLEEELLKNYAPKELAFDPLTLDNENGSNKESHDGNLSVPPLSKVLKKCEGSEVSHYKHTKRKETTKRCLKKNCVAAVHFGGSCICPSSQDKDKKERRNSKTEKEAHSDVKLDANNSQTGCSIKSFTCELCKRVFPSSNKLSAHVSKCCGETQPSKLPEVFICNECNLAFFSQNNLWEHKEQAHSCNAASATSADLSLQVMETLAEERLLLENLPFLCCRTCQLVYKTLAEFHLHTCTRLTNVTDCNYLELIGRQLITSTEQLKALKKYKCGVCQEEYRSHSRMLYHLSRCRRGPYKCELCQEQFDIKKALNLHKKKSHRGVKCFFCDECSLSFKFCTSLQKHKVNRHEKEQGTFLCEQCDSVFTKKIQLTNHKIQTHQVERKFLCQVCGKKLSNSNSLNTHLDTHSEMRKFSCSFCNKTFRQKEKLKYHTRTHTGERPHLCQTCGKSFIRKSRLDDHILRHQGKKRYRCGHCSKSYAGAWDLKQHVKKQHPTVEEMSPTKPERKKTGSGLERADDDSNNPDDPVAIIDEEDEEDEDGGSHSEEECADRQPGILSIPHISVDPKQTENQLASLPLLSQGVVQSGTNAAENNEILLHLNPVTSVLQNSTPSSLNQPKILLHLDSLQLQSPSLYLRKNSNEFGSKFLLQLNNSSEQQNQSLVGTMNSSDSNSRILIQLDPRHSQSELLSANGGGSTNSNSRILLQLNPVAQQSQTQAISTNTILTLADTIHLVDDVNLGGLMTQYIQLTSAQTETTRTGDLPVIQLPTQGSSAATYQLQGQPGQIFTVSGFEIPTITL